MRPRQATLTWVAGVVGAAALVAVGVRGLPAATSPAPVARAAPSGVVPASDVATAPRARRPTTRSCSIRR